MGPDTMILFSECWALSQLFHLSKTPQIVRNYNCSCLNLCIYLFLAVLGLCCCEQAFSAAAAAAAKSLQSCPILCDLIDGSPGGSPIPGILQARTLEWVAISLSNAGKWKVRVKSLSRVRLLATPWTAAYQAPLSMGFSRQEYWAQLYGSLNILWHCLFWDWNENWLFPVLWPLLTFPNVLAYWVQHFNSIIF